MLEAEEMSTRRLLPPHPVTNRELFASLADSMSADGWVGRPLLGWEAPDGYVRLLTGSHRYAAAKASETEPPVALVEVPEGVLEADGEDLRINGLRVFRDDELVALLDEHDPEAAALLRQDGRG